MKLLRIKKADKVGDTPRVCEKIGDLDFSLYQYTRMFDAQAKLVPHMDEEDKKELRVSMVMLDRSVKNFLNAEKKFLESLK